MQQSRETERAGAVNSDLIANDGQAENKHGLVNTFEKSSNDKESNKAIGHEGAQLPQYPTADLQNHHHTDLKRAVEVPDAQNYSEGDKLAAGGLPSLSVTETAPISSQGSAGAYSHGVSTNHVDTLPDFNHMYVDRKMQESAEAKLSHKFSRLLTAKDLTKDDDDKSFYDDIPDLERASTIRQSIYPHLIEAASGSIPLADRTGLRQRMLAARQNRGNTGQDNSDDRKVAVSGSRFAEDLPRTPSQKSEYNKRALVATRGDDRPPADGTVSLSGEDRQRHQSAENLLLQAAPAGAVVAAVPFNSQHSITAPDFNGRRDDSAQHIAGDEHRHRALRTIYGQPVDLEEQRASPNINQSQHTLKAHQGNESVRLLEPENRGLHSRATIYSHNPSTVSRLSIIAPSTRNFPKSRASTVRRKPQKIKSQGLPGNPLWQRKPAGYTSSLPDSPWTNRKAATGWSDSRSMMRAPSTRSRRTMSVREPGLGRAQSVYSQRTRQSVPAIQIHNHPEHETRSLIQPSRASMRSKPLSVRSHGEQSTKFRYLEQESSQLLRVDPAQRS